MCTTNLFHTTKFQLILFFSITSLFTMGQDITNGLMLYLDASGDGTDQSGNDLETEYMNYNTYDKFGNPNEALGMFASVKSDELADDLRGLTSGTGAISLWFKPSYLSYFGESEGYLFSVTDQNHPQNSEIDMTQLAGRAGAYYDPGDNDPTSGEIKTGVEVFLKNADRRNYGDPSFDTSKEWALLKEVEMDEYMDEWHHVVISSDGYEVSLKVNETNPITVMSDGWWDDINYIQNFSINRVYGIDGYESLLGIHNAAYDEIRVYDRALSTNEIDLLYNFTYEPRAFDDWTFDGLNTVHLSNDYSVGIGTNNVTEKLTINGTVLAEAVKVVTDIPDVPDYVFDEDYHLMSLEELEQFIKNESHLPNIPAADQIIKEGLDLEQMNLKLLEKIEELTLYTLQQEKTIESQENQYEELLSRLTSYQERVNDLLKKKNDTADEIDK